VIAFNPLRLKSDNGTSYTVTVPGQTPTAKFVPSSLTEVKPGTSVMLFCSEKNGTKKGLIAHSMIIDASPVEAMGF
jgi:hypothetical protein